MNPWPDDYTTPPDELAAKQCWDVAMKSAGEPIGAPMLREVGRYLHWLTEELAGLQALCDEQAAELASIERCDECDGGFW